MFVLPVGLAVGMENFQFRLVSCVTNLKSLQSVLFDANWKSLVWKLLLNMILLGSCMCLVLLSWIPCTQSLFLKIRVNFLLLNVLSTKSCLRYKRAGKNVACIVYLDFCAPKAL